MRGKTGINFANEPGTRPGKVEHEGITRTEFKAGRGFMGSPRDLCPEQVTVDAVSELDQLALSLIHI